jgi:hypothetical protein
VSGDAGPSLHRMPDELAIEDTTWLTLGQLRALVAKADELHWGDNALISHGVGSDHVRLRDARIARRLVIEGHDPKPAQS